MEHRKLLENILFDLLKDSESPLNNYCDYQIQHICRQIGVKDFGDLKDYTFYKQFANQFLNYLDQINETQSIIQSALQSYTLQNNIIDDHQNQFKQINQHQIIPQNQTFIPPKTINNQIHIADDDILEISNPILNLEANHIKPNTLPNFNTQIHTQHQQQQLINQQLDNINQNLQINKPEPLLKIDSKPSSQFQTNAKKNLSSCDFKKKANNLIRNIEQKEAQYNKLQLNTSSSEEKLNRRLDIIKKKDNKTSQHTKNNDGCLEISDFKHSEDQSLSKDSNLKKIDEARNLIKQNNKYAKETQIQKKNQSKEKIGEKKKKKSTTCEKKKKDSKDKMRIQKKDQSQVSSSNKEKKSENIEKNQIQRIEKEKEKSQHACEKNKKEEKQKDKERAIKEKEVIEINQSAKQLQQIQKQKENKHIDKEIKEVLEQNKEKRLQESEKEQQLFQQMREIKEKEKRKELELLEQQKKKKEQKEKLLKEQENSKSQKLQQEQKKIQGEAELTIGQLKDRDDVETNKFQSNDVQLGIDIIQNLELWDMVSKILCTNDQQEIVTQQKQVQSVDSVQNNEKNRKKKEKEQTKFNKSQCNYCCISETKSLIEVSEGVTMCSYCLLEGLNPLQKIQYKVCFVEHICSGKEGGKISQQFSIDQSLNCNLEIRCIALNKNNIYDFTFPMHCSISINGQLIKQFKPLPEKSSLKKRKDQSLIITYKELLKYISKNSSSKKLVFQCVEHATENGNRKDVIGAIYCFGLFQVQPLTVNQAVERYKVLDIKSKVSNEQCKNEIKIEKCKVSLICQFSQLDYIQIPVKGQYCQHKQCFCLQNYLEIMSKAEHRKWSCPICRKLCFNLVIDKYQKFVIDRVKQLEIAVEQIILDQDGLLDKEDEINKILLDLSIKSYSDIIIRNYTNIQKIERQEDEEDEKIHEICVSNKKDFILIDD